MVNAEEEGGETLQEALYAFGIGDNKEENTPLEEDLFKGSPTGVLVAIDNLDDPPEAYYNSAFLMHTCDFAIFHALIKRIVRVMRYGEEKFYDILVDTGANRLSTIGKG